MKLKRKGKKPNETTKHFKSRSVARDMARFRMRDKGMRRINHKVRTQKGAESPFMATWRDYVL